MGIQENQLGSETDRSPGRTSGAGATGSDQQGDAAAVLSGTLERLTALLTEQDSGRGAAPIGSALGGLQPVLFIKWRSAISDATGESFLAVAGDGSIAIYEGTPQQPGEQLWSSQNAQGAAATVAPAAQPAQPAQPEVSAPPRVEAAAKGAPSTAPKRAPMQEVFITSRSTGKRLAIDGARTDSSARLVLQAPNGGAHQRFFASIHEGGYMLRAAQSPFVVNAALGRQSQGWQLIEIASHNSEDPGLAIEETAEGDYRIRAPQSGRWLATAQVNGNEVPVLDASFGQEQASRWLIHAAPATPRLAVLDLASVAPRPKTDGTLDVVVPAGQLPAVDALPGSPFRAFTGDFLKRGRDQLLLVRPDSKYHHVELLEFADGSARTLASAVLEPGSWIDGWLGPNDLQLVGNLSGHGSSQLLLLHRGQRRPGEQAVLLSLQNGLEAPRKLYADNWGERQWLDGWLDPNDVHMVGDFMGLGYDQWMMMNRNPRGGRVRIVDIKGGTPRRCYTEMWGQSPLLDGWMDEGRIMLAGDFLKRGHMQVLFINRNIAINTGKILIADFCRAAPPAEVCYRELWGQSDLVNDFIADSDVQIAGDFMGRGYAQALFVSRKGEGEKFLVADFHRGAPPAEACVREQWGQRARHESLVHPGSVVLAGKFRRLGDSRGAAQVILL